MSERARLEPGVDHPITVELTGHPVTATVDAHRLAASEQTLTLREAGYDPVIYFPAADVDPGVLRASTSVSYCPYKGDAGYVDVVVPNTGKAAPGDHSSVVSDAGWFYAAPYDAVADIAGHIAFYPERVHVVSHMLAEEPIEV